MALSVVIPAFNPSRSLSQGLYNKAQDVRDKPRTYGDGPLPTQLSQCAPKDASIVERIDSNKGPLYKLKLGSVELTDISLDEVLDYVSPQELETFENQKFVEECEILKIVEAEEQRAREEEKLRIASQRAQKHTMKITASDSLDESDESHGEITHNPKPVEMSSGRPRPSYTHLYEKFKVRQRRKRNALTGELVDFSDGEVVESRSSEDDRAFGTRPSLSVIQPFDLPKRRRRKRDKVTGELLPLSPRNEMHFARQNVTNPILLPVDDVTKGTEYLPSRGEATRSLSMGGLRISEEPEAKRLKLKAQRTVPSQSPVARFRPVSQPPTDCDPKLSHRNVLEPGTSTFVDLTISEDELVATHQPEKTEEYLKYQIIRDTEHTTTEVENLMQLKLTASAAKISPELGKEIDPTSPATNRSTSERINNAEKIEDSNEDDEFEIETILGHGMSDPKTHPVGLGPKSVMLYRVKWAGYDEPTWEPLGSFGDLDIVEEYHRQNSLQSLGKLQCAHRIQDSVTAVAEDKSIMAATATTSDKSHMRIKPTAPTRQVSYATTSLTRPSAAILDDESESLEDGEYEIDSIISHHLSDPRTHPPGLGKAPIMLYHVRWKGYDETTWEPVESFPDRRLVIEYRKKVGLSYEVL